MILNVEDESTGPFPLTVLSRRRRVRTAASGARQRRPVATEEMQFKRFKRELGVSLNVETNCPVTGFGCTSPASFTREPEIGSST